MNTSDVPYSIAPAGKDESEFDLRDLGATVYVHVAMVGSSHGPTKHFGHDRQVTADDYDRQFRDKLRKVQPPQRVRDLLDHHRAHFEEHGRDPAVFLDHVHYNVLLQLEQHYATSPNTKAARDWFNKSMDNIHKQHQVTKAKFLSKAFELALERDPAKPTKVQIQLEEMATLMDIDAATARRIRDELAQDGLVKRIGSYPMFLIDDDGRRAVERMHNEPSAPLPSFVINTGHGSPVVLQANSPNATQTANIGLEIEETQALTERVTAKLQEIEQLITADQFKALKGDLDYLKTKLQEPQPKPSLIAELRSGLIAGLAGLPVELATFLLGKAAGA